MPLPEHQGSSPQPSEPKLDAKKTERKVNILRRSDSGASSPVLSKSPSRIGHVHDDDDELPESIPSITHGPSCTSTTSSFGSHSSRSNSFHQGSPSFTSSIPIPVSSFLPPSPYSVVSGMASSLDSGSSSDHVTLSQDQDDDLSDSDDELPPSEPTFGLGSPSVDSEAILSDDEDFPSAPTLMRQTGHYKAQTSRACSCLEPEERTDADADSFIYSR